jgi:hypothetical protein
MTRKLLALAACALTVLLMSSPFDSADARGRGHGGWSGGGRSLSVGRSFSAPRFYGGSSYRSYAWAGPRIHHRRHFRRGIIVGAPLAYGAYYYGSGCEWLRRRALYTGSGYWWNRYYACVDGYY